jgi:uncharacterized membrane protein
MHRLFLVAVVALSLAVLGTRAVEQSKSDKRTYEADVAPIVSTYCLPCHLAENENPSGLHLDTYETMLKGGEKGVPITAGKPEESFFYTKLTEDPPFGKQMPRGKKKMTPEEIQIIKEWIEQGALKK